MKLLMISGDRSVVSGKKGAFWYTLEELARHWERIDVICPATQDARNKTQETRPFPSVFFHPSPYGLWCQPRWIVSRGALLHAEHGYDVMTVHEYPPFYNGRGARRLSRRTGIPAVLEIHHVVGYPAPSSLTERAGLALSRYVLPAAVRASAGTRTVNDATKQLLVSFGAPAEKIHVVPSFYLDSALRSLPPAEKRYDLVFAARLAPNKGLQELLEALRSLPGRTLAVAGDGPMLAEAEAKAAALGVGDRVAFLGWLPAQEDVLRTMREGKVFVMNSRSEGGPRSALEAMACGLPVVATRVGVMPDVIVDGKNGLYTDGTPGDLARILGPLLSDVERRARLGEGARKILDRFERKTLVKAYADFLKLIADS